MFAKIVVRLPLESYEESEHFVSSLSHSKFERSIRDWLAIVIANPIRFLFHIASELYCDPTLLSLIREEM